MFLRPHDRWQNGERQAYWALVESYRTERGPRQRTVAYLGQMDEAGRLGVEQAADPRPVAHQSRLFAEAEAEPRYVETDRTRVRVENCRQFGGPWLALELIRQLGLDQFLKRTLRTGQEHVPWSLTALILVIARLCEPSSELHIAEHFYRQSALADLLGVSPDQVDDNRLSRGLDELLPHKPALEVFLKERFGELFGIEYDLLLYDVASTCFEGQGKANPLAQRGYSRDHRPDCKQVCIGLVGTRCGLPLGYEVFAGNRHDSTTLEEIVTTMEARYGKAQRIWVLDRGMVSDEKIEFLKEGRLLGQNTRAAGLFDVQVRAGEKGAAEIEWKRVEAWRSWAQLSEGAYVLRSNVSDWSDDDLWHAYIQLTEAEAAFRIQNSDLSLRPVWHQKEERVRAHILVCFLAYVLWKFLGQLCRKAGLGDEPRRVLAELSELRTVDVILPTKTGPELRTRCITQPPPPENPARPLGLEAARIPASNGNVVEKSGCRPLRRKNLRRLLGKLG